MLNAEGSKAPPSTAHKIVDIPENHKAIIERYAVSGTFVGPSEAESPWAPFGEQLYL